MFLAAALIAAFGGCDKEKVLESTETEYVHDIEYVQLPPDTVMINNTVYHHDTVTVFDTDTIYRVDTVAGQIVYDTVVQVHNHYDTTTVYLHDTISNTYYIHDTVFVNYGSVDTVTIVQTIHDTTTIVQTVHDTTTVVVTVHDTVTVSGSGTPNAYLAYTALQYYTDDAVFDVIYENFEVSGGWVLYQSIYECDIEYPATYTYDIYGQIDYWTEEWDSFYPLEFYWRMKYVSGDPANPTNWSITEPPTVSGMGDPGVNRVANRAPIIVENKR